MTERTYARTRKIYRSISAVVWMVMIFCFSNQSAVDSSASSGRLSSLLGNFYQLINGQCTAAQQLAFMDKAEILIRKGAHVAEYLILGFLVYYAVTVFIENVPKKRMVTFLIVLTFCITDEVHQLFIPGRSCELRDILIDAGGIVLALLIIEFRHRKPKPERKWDRSVLVMIITVVIVITALQYTYSGTAVKAYTAEELGIEQITGTHDEDGDGIDDYTDLLEGARAYLNERPLYKSAYYEGGYPDDGFGVCADVIWYAFREAGYDFKAMVDQDIQDYPERYAHIVEPDPNIDFRRVKNLQIFLKNNLTVLTNDLKDAKEWQPGDIVVFSNPGHIAICSDLRRADGVPFIVHLNYSGVHEADDMDNYTVIGHYRIPEE